MAYLHLDWYQLVSILLIVCRFLCDSASVNDSNNMYQTQKWIKEISDHLLLECSDVCSGRQCSWRYDSVTISNSSKVTLKSTSDDYGEYSCYNASQVVRKVLVIPRGTFSVLVAS